jgi:hypothetical protein
MLAACFHSLLATDGETAGSEFLGQLGSSLLSLGDLGGLLGGVELDVAVRREVRSNTTVGTVGSAAALLGALNGDVGDDALIDVETLRLAVRLQIVEEQSDSLHGLFRPSAGVGANLLALGVSLSEVLGEADDGFVLKDLLEVGEGSLDSHAPHGVGGVESVLEVGALVLNLGHSGLGLLSGLSRVLNHCKSLPIY